VNTRIVTRLVKRLRVLWAAATQEWHTHTCSTCQRVWWCQAAEGLHEGDLCATCEAATMAAWVRELEIRTGKQVA